MTDERYDAVESVSKRDEARQGADVKHTVVFLVADFLEALRMGEARSRWRLLHSLTSAASRARMICS